MLNHIKKYSFRQELLNKIEIESSFKGEATKIITKINEQTNRMSIMIYYDRACIWSSDFPENEIDIPISFTKEEKTDFKKAISGLAIEMMKEIDCIVHNYEEYCKLDQQLNVLFSLTRASVPKEKIMKSRLVLEDNELNDISICFDNLEYMVDNELCPLHITYKDKELRYYCYDDIVDAREVMKVFVKTREIIFNWLFYIMKESIENNIGRCESNLMIMKKTLLGLKTKGE